MADHDPTVNTCSPLRRILHTLLVTLLVATTATAAEQSSESILLGEIARASNQSLLWGPYRPNLYFGIKPRVPDSFFAGLMWSHVNDFKSFQNTFRHQCEQGDNMAGYGWEEYDVRTGGRQVVHDTGNHIDLTTEFVKVEGGQNGGNWGVRIKGELRDDDKVRTAPAKKDTKTTLIFYVGNQGKGSIQLANEPDVKGLVGDVQLDGKLPVLGDFNVKVTTGPATNLPPQLGNADAWAERPLERTMYSSTQVPGLHTWKTKEIFVAKLQQNFKELQAKYGKENHPPPWQTFVMKPEFGPGNVHMIQKVFEGPFEFDVLYSSASAPEPMTSEILTQKIKENHETFLERFDKVFKRQAPFDTENYTEFAYNLFSNLLGGIGYFHGTSIVDRSYADEYLEEDEGFWEAAQEAQKRPASTKEEGPSELFTSIPSRPFFPRGFYWDEGFHLLPISEWDMDLTLNIVKSWFSLMDEDGWIAREQILGDEARSKVPPEFQTQYPHYANPPTLFFILTKFIDAFEATQASGAGTKADVLEGISTEELPSAHLHNPEAAIQFLREIYPKLRRHYQWFRTTQSGDIREWDREAFSTKEAYRWRGRTPEHCLTSGLDDYPRAIPPHTGELHVDLISWVGMMTNCIKRIAYTINEVEDAKEYEKIEYAVKRNIDDLHWSSKEEAYCDATIDDYEESIHVCHKGYISLFPVLLGLVDKDSEKLGKVLDLMEDPEQLWTEFGLRSLSKADPLFGTGENYWKGPIWINVNFLAVKRLAEYAAQTGPYQAQAARIYTKLRKALVENVYKNWKETGYAWEQYDSVSGRGQRTAHFLGWTSLVINLMSMPEMVAPPKAPVVEKVKAVVEEVVQKIEEAANADRLEELAEIRDEL
ncbi:glycoside hydrolase [Sphaerosporella brunnea]|uniref:Mannosyl-oligosaccharide glucosidase n=1 Tax=Sphaerosporella brunnea TaxID=1250544 RepID=A0A5J5EKW1_9PEZI|nr:glycoside hydrolase [Sphaerosporella brunnea]